MAPEAGRRAVLPSHPLVFFPAAEGVPETLKELLVHEAVRDGVTAGGGVREEVHEGDADGPEGSVNLLWDVKAHDIHHEDWSPAYEELEHHDEEHSDDVLLGFDALLQVGTSKSLEGWSRLLTVGGFMVPISSN